jgi:hypothetical protein
MNFKSSVNCFLLAEETLLIKEKDAHDLTPLQPSSNSTKDASYGSLLIRSPYFLVFLLMGHLYTFLKWDG